MDIFKVPAEIAPAIIYLGCHPDLSLDLFHLILSRESFGASLW